MYLDIYIIIWITYIITRFNNEFQNKCPGKFLDSIFFKLVFIIPLFGFLYYFNYIVLQKGELIKPLPQRLYFFEAPLAFYFSLGFIPFLIAAIMGSNLLKSGIVNTILTNRILSGIALFGCFYIVIWRLNGGLFIDKKKYDSLKASLDQIIADEKRV